MATRLRGLKRPDEAAQSYRRAVRVRPAFVEAHNNLGVVLGEMGRGNEAVSSYRCALDAEPDFAEAHLNLGNALSGLGQLVEAAESYRRARQSKPDLAEAHNRLGDVSRRLGRLDEALASYRRLRELAPSSAEARWNEGRCLLLMGDLEAGWEKYESRFDTAAMGLSRRVGTRPQWLGREDIAGKRLFIRPEQGYGDAIQFCRYADILSRQGAHVILAVPSRLQRLLAGVSGVGQVIATDDPIPDHDFECPLLSVPLALGIRRDAVPADIPYVSAPPELLPRWEARLGDGPRPRVGIAWAGRPDHTDDHNRSLELAALAPLLSRDV